MSHPIKLFGSYTLEGYFHTNEDTYIIIEDYLKVDKKGINISYAGIYDGHGGLMCAEYVKSNLHKNILSELEKYTSIIDDDENNFDNIMMASLLNGFSITERDFLVESKNKQDYSGTCAISVLITNEKIYVANLGDSRALLFKVTKDGKYNYMQISRDHKAKLEKKRISKIGGYIKAGRVNGVLEISRTIGDREFKNPKYEVRGPCKIRSIKPTVFHIIEDPQKVILKRIDEKYQTRYKKEKESGKDIDNYIILDYLNEEIDIENTKQDIPVYPKAIFDTYASAFPEVSIIKRDNNDKMILIASDGFYDSFTNKRVLTLYKEMVTNKDHMDSDILNNICKELCEKAKEKGSKDDITTILLCINQ